MTLSSRYAPALAAVLAFSLVPAAIRTYTGERGDGRQAADLRVSLDGTPGIETPRNADWVRRRLGSSDWIERRYTVAGGNLVLFVGRSYDPKALYHHPELALAYGEDLESRGVIDAGGIPVHTLVARSGSSPIVLYALEADGRFVTDPVRYQIRSAAAGLFTGRGPMTLFFVVQRGGPATSDLSNTPAARLLRTAVAAFRAL